MGYMVPIMVAAKRKKILDAFRALGATDTDSARTLEELGLGESRMLSSLRNEGLIRPVQGNRYYVDAEEMDRLEDWRRKKALIILPPIVLLVIYLLARG